jgi:hypothetical protein
MISFTNAQKEKHLQNYAPSPPHLHKWVHGVLLIENRNAAHWAICHAPSMVLYDIPSLSPTCGIYCLA